MLCKRERSWVDIVTVITISWVYLFLVLNWYGMISYIQDIFGERIGKVFACCFYAVIQTAVVQQLVHHLIIPQSKELEGYNESERSAYYEISGVSEDWTIVDPDFLKSLGGRITI